MAKAKTNTIVSAPIYIYVFGQIFIKLFLHGNYLLLMN